MDLNLMFDPEKLAAVLNYLKAELPDAYQIHDQLDFAKTAQSFSVRHKGQHDPHRVLIEKSGFEHYTAEQLVSLIREHAIDRFRHAAPSIELWISDRGPRLSS